MAGYAVYETIRYKGINDMSIFEEFKRSKELVKETEFVKIYKFVCDEKEYRIVMPYRVANRRTIIHCEDSYIYWEQIPILPRMGGIYGDKVPVYKWNKKTDVVTIFVIRGRPGGVKGLDAGIFRSANNFDEDYLNVMSYRRFKKI